MQNPFGTKTQISLGFKIEKISWFQNFEIFVHEILNLISDVQYTSLKYDYKPHRIDYEKQGILGIGCTHTIVQNLWYP